MNPAPWPAWPCTSASSVENEREWVDRGDKRSGGQKSVKGQALREVGMTRRIAEAGEPRQVEK